MMNTTVLRLHPATVLSLNFVLVLAGFSPQCSGGGGKRPIDPALGSAIEEVNQQISNNARVAEDIKSSHRAYSSPPLGHEPDNSEVDDANFNTLGNGYRVLSDMLKEIRDNGGTAESIKSAVSFNNAWIDRAVLALAKSKRPKHGDYQHLDPVPLTKAWLAIGKMNASERRKLAIPDWSSVQP